MVNLFSKIWRWPNFYRRLAQWDPPYWWKLEKNRIMKEEG